jgi:SAM-dependent methyltransferase
MQAPALFQQAQSDLQANRRQQAVDALAQCVRLHPDFAPAFLVFADLVRLDAPGVAFQLLSQVLERFPEHHGAATQALATLLPTLNPKQWHPSLERALLACFDNPQPLARCAARLLLLKHPVADLEAAEQDPVWRTFLTRCINVDAQMEARITQLMAQVEPTSPLYPALALQAFATEYCRRLPDSRPTPLNTPLIDLPDFELPEGELWSELARRTRDDLLEERRLTAEIPSLGVSADSVSQAVRAQYEANPYPRWQAPPAPAPRDLRAFLQSFGADPAADLQILVAGCGTGYEAIDLARTDRSAIITALDLSRASLAYAQRMAAELGLTNLRFIQGDILDLPALDTRFDLVTSTGVLHHMRDPAAGLASLTAVTRPGGLLRLSLYSHHARAPIRAAHQLIRERGWLPDRDGIAAFRSHVLNLPAEAPLASLRDSDDFYTLSGCRDLVFHVHEHQFTLPEVERLLSDLRLVGFDAPPEALSLFGSGDPLDLDRWDQLEQRHPTLFAGMYQLLVQVPAA